MRKASGAIFDENENVVARIEVNSRTLNEMEVTIVGKSQKPLEQGSTASFKLYDPVNGLISYTGLLQEVEEERLHITRVSNMEGESNRRMDVKVMVNRPVFVIERTEKDGDVVLEKFHVRLRDISAGGACMVSTKEFNKNASYEMVFDLGRSPDILGFRILRYIKSERGEFVYGCAFVDVTAPQENRIREFVFRKQLGLVGRLRSEGR